MNSEERTKNLLSPSGESLLAVELGGLNSIVLNKIEKNAVKFLH